VEELPVITLNVNGTPRKLDIPEDMPLLWTPRDVLSMTGTKFGCGMGLCGACTIQIDGQPTRSCITPASAAAGKQMQSGIVFGLSGALYGEITIKDGRVEQTNLGDYRVLRINEVPQIEVHLVKSLEAPGGIREPGTSCVMPALTNAIFAATGKRIRKLPVGEQASTA
jgi:hypothetical protein